MFKEWPKTPRYEDSNITFSEKIDGTNSCIIVENNSIVGVQSRNRLITRESDNMGFANWVYDNQEELASLLGDGYHYGEWWGLGIQRRYNMERKVFSLFNAHRWKGLFNAPAGQMLVDVVPSYTVHLNDGASMDALIAKAKEYFMGNSIAAAKYGKEFSNPEGFVMYHDRSQQLYKFPINK